MWPLRAWFNTSVCSSKSKPETESTWLILFHWKYQSLSHVDLKKGTKKMVCVSATKKHRNSLAPIRSEVSEAQLQPWNHRAADRVFFFPECVARVPVSFGGLGVRLCSRKVVSMFATVRNRSQTFATVCVSAVRLSTVASASGVVPKSCQVDASSPQLYWRLQRRCLCE